MTDAHEFNLKHMTDAHDSDQAVMRQHVVVVACVLESHVFEVSLRARMFVNSN
jgi:hypothetical protein